MCSDSSDIEVLPSSFKTLAVRNLQANLSYRSSFSSSYLHGFDLVMFFHRYLCGGYSSKHHLAVSRKRLAIVTSRIGSIDVEAIALQNQIDNYRLAKKAILSEKELSLDLLCVANGLLTPEKESAGKIRNNQNWIGRSLNNASYIPPNCTELPRLLDDLIDISYSSQYTPLEKAFAFYQQLLAIHPFSEGNGRTARLILEVMLEQQLGVFIHPYIYQLVVDKQGYRQAVRAFSLNNSTLIAEDYWIKALKWGQAQIKNIEEIVECTQQFLNKKIQLVSLSNVELQLLDILWQQPIVCHKTIVHQMNLSSAQAASLINNFQQLGLLHARRLRSPQHSSVYDVPEIVLAHSQIEHVLFNSSR